MKATENGQVLRGQINAISNTKYRYERTGFIILMCTKKETKCNITC